MEVFISAHKTDKHREESESGREIRQIYPQAIFRILALCANQRETFVQEARGRTKATPVRVQIHSGSSGDPFPKLHPCRRGLNEAAWTRGS
jgi:hypothetical protein